MNPITVRCWGVGVTQPLTIRENDEGDIDFAKDADSINAEVILHRDDARRVGEWLIAFADEAEAKKPKGSGNEKR